MLFNPEQEDDRKRLETTGSDQIGIDLVYGFRALQVSEGRGKKALKGSVVVQNFKGWLRLRWSWGGKRYALSTGLPESKINRTIAESKARLIERDIVTEQFDPTLARYKPEMGGEDQISAIELFEKFTDYKRKQLDARSIEKYFGLQAHLRQFFRSQKASDVTEDRGFQFRDWLSKKLAPITTRERLTMLRSCWQWGIKRGLVKVNPWMEVKLKVPPKQKPRPFTKDEVERILKGFQEDKNYRHYADVVEFLLSVGCRPGEAFGLRWKHLNDDCSVIWIGEAWSRGRQKATKTNEDRAFTLTPRLQKLLLNRRPLQWHPDDLVFPSRRGKPIDDHNFRNRAWKTVLSKVGVPYRKPYNSRHSFVSHAAAQGLSPSEIAEITGHSEETIFRSYLGSVKGRVQLPELWD